MSNNINPKLSVLLVTYNHEKYIRHALDSVLMQETDFDFEIVVADDHSTDSTITIIEEYRVDNHNIRVLPSERNVGITRNYQRGFGACRGEYIAVLEGDDFWISPMKLKSLVAFLQQHQECAFCFHRFLRHDESYDRFTVYPTLETTTEFILFTASQLASGNFIGNFSTCVYRRGLIDRLDPALFEMKVYDWMFNVTVALEGMIGYFPEIMSVYRAHSASAWSSKTEDEHRPELLDLIDDYNEYLGFKFDVEFQACKFALLAGTSLPMGGPLEPRVSVLLVTHNHENSIHQALNSVVMQNTVFDFEIVVADDHSEDSTLAILKEYQANNPNIRILTSTERIGLSRNYQRGFEACRGKYVAVLEGDDFWTSPKKLELTSAFLDQYPDCSICFHRLIRHDEVSDSTIVHPSLETQSESVFFTASQLANEDFIGNFSTCTYRRDVIDKLDPELWQLKVHEWPFNIAVAQQGTIGYIPEIMSVYRVRSASISSSETEDEHRPELLDLIDGYNKYLDFKFDAEFQACKSALLAGTPLPMGGPFRPRVSVLLVAYNHEQFIRQALDGVLMQNAVFDFEIVVADDYSSDATLTIAKEFQANNPNIRILPSTARMGITRNYQRGFEACRGKYVAVLDGDDYWISRNKLQLASRFLDEHEQCSLCFHRIIRHDEPSNHAAAYPTFAPEEESNIFTARQLATGNFIGGFSTCMYRSETIARLDPRIWKMKVREWLFNIAVAEKGSIGYLPGIMSIYRVHPGGIWSLKPPDQKTSELIELIDSYNEYLDFKFDPELGAVKHSLLQEAEARRLAEATARRRRWVKAFVPPVLLSLARKIYSRAPSPA